MGKDMNRHFYKEDIHMSNKYMKKCSISLIIGEIQIKTTRYPYIPTGMICLKTDNTKCWRWSRGTGTLIQWW